MADFNSSLPVRTQTNADIVAAIADALVPSQTLSIDASGRVTVNQGTSPWVVSGTITALNASVGLNATTAPTSSTEIGGIVSASAPTYIDGDLDALSLTTTGLLRVDGSGVTQPVSIAAAVSVTQGTSPWVTSVNSLPAIVDTDYGAVGASTLRSAAQIGSATGAADFNAGATGAQTLRVVANQGAANGTPWNENIAQIAGVSPSASNSLPIQISTGAAFVSASNPLPVIIDPQGAGTSINDFKDATAIAAGGSDSHDYTVTSGKTLKLQQIEASGSGKAKLLVSVETGVATGVFTTYFVQFNSTAETNMSIKLVDPISVAAGVRVRAVMSNRDLAAQDLYSTISGFEI